MYSFIHISINQINNSNITGEISNDPKLGRNRLILLSHWILLIDKSFPILNKQTYFEYLKLKSNKPANNYIGNYHIRIKF